MSTRFVRRSLLVIALTFIFTLSTAVAAVSAEPVLQDEDPVSGESDEPAPEADGQDGDGIVVPVSVYQDGDLVSARPATTYAEAEVYWTAERMENAQPYPLPMADGDHAAEGEALFAGPTGELFMSAPSAGDTLDPSTVAFSGGESYGYTGFWPYSSMEAAYGSNKSYPTRTIGKLFFKQNGLDYSCSGAVVYQNVVWTAGHCVHDGSGLTSGWSYDVEFVPGYDGTIKNKKKRAPYGVFSADEVWGLSGWINGADYSYDMGAIVMKKGSKANKKYTGEYQAEALKKKKKKKKHVGDTVGWLGFLANASDQQHWNQFGYPANLGGSKKLWNCQSSFAETDSVHTSGDGSIGVGCDMEHGSSGGPWVVAWGDPAGYVNGNVSHGHVVGSGEYYGPYFGDGAVNLFCSASGAC